MTTKNILVIAWQWNNTGGDWSYAKSITSTYIEKGFRVTVLSSGNSHEELGQIKTIRTKSLLKRDINSFKDKLRFPWSFLSQNQLSSDEEKYLFNTEWYFVHIHSIIGGPGFKVIQKIKPNTPILYTLHDYHLSCPTTNHFRNGENCMECINESPLNSIKNNCRGNIFESTAAYLLNKLFINSNEIKRIKYFLCPSEFMNKTMIKFGISKEKLKTIGYCLDQNSLKELLSEDNILFKKKKYKPFVFYAGRLESYKGIKTLIEACSKIGLRLLIAGDGSFKNYLTKYIKNHKLDVKLLGKIPKKELANYIRNSICVVVPSEWHENFPFAVTESLFLGTPVIGSSMGGIPELIRNGYNGYIFEAKNAIDLRKKLSLIMKEGVFWKKREIMNDIRQRFDCNNHLDKILDLV